MITKDLDETARLVLLDGADSFLAFVKAVGLELPDVPLKDLELLYRRYRGWDRISATHDIETGLHLGWPR